MTVRQLQIDDVSSVTAMIRDCFDSELWPYMTFAQHGIDDFLAVFLNYPQSSRDRDSIVLCEEGALLAFADFRLSDDQNGFLSYICVDPEARGRGAARGLIQDFISRHPLLQTLQLDVFRENAAAVALYKKLGFQTKDTSAWVSRQLPESRVGEIRTFSLATSLAAYDAYGFCEIDVALGGTRIKVGVLGPSTLKLPMEHFENDELIAGLHEMFPKLERAFSVVSESALRGLDVDHKIVNVTERMALAIPSSMNLLPKGAP